MQLPGVRLVRLSVCLSVCPVSHTLLCGLQRRSRCGIQVQHRQAPASTECCRSRRQRHAEVRPRTQPSPARRAALAGRSSAGAVQAVCNGPSTSAAQSITVHDGLLHPHLRHCSSPASAVRTAGCHQLFVPRHWRSMFGRRAFSVAGPAAWNSLPDYLRDTSRSFGSFFRDLKIFLVLLVYTAHSWLCDYEHSAWPSLLG